jgi:hypothetical protein
MAILTDGDGQATGGAGVNLFAFVDGVLRTFRPAISAVPTRSS